jgi:hypothetical protein
VLVFPSDHGARADRRGAARRGDGPCRRSLLQRAASGPRAPLPTDRPRRRSVARRPRRRDARRGAPLAVRLWEGLASGWRRTGKKPDELLARSAHLPIPVPELSRAGAVRLTPPDWGRPGQLRHDPRRGGELRTHHAHAAQAESSRAGRGLLLCCGSAAAKPERPRSALQRGTSVARPREGEQVARLSACCRYDRASSGPAAERRRAREVRYRP